MKAALLTLFRMAASMRTVSVVFCVALAACSMPRLEDPPNSLAKPPNFSDVPQEPAANDPLLAFGQSGQGDAGGPSQPEVMAGPVSVAVADDRIGAQAVQAAEVVQTALPSLPPGTLRGYSTVFGIDLSDDAGLICAGRPAPGSKILQMGESIPVACSDGSWGKVRIEGRDQAGFVAATLSMDRGVSKPVQIVER
jgi:hypothetical protein